MTITAFEFVEPSIFTRPFFIEPAKDGTFVISVGYPGGTISNHDGQVFTNHKYGFTDVADLLEFLSKECKKL